MDATSARPGARRRSRASVTTGNGRGTRSVRTTCRRYTSIFLLLVGVAVSAALVLLDVWWGLAGAVLIAFLFGALIARPWCTGAAGNGRATT